MERIQHIDRKQDKVHEFVELLVKVSTMTADRLSSPTAVVEEVGGDDAVAPLEQQLPPAAWVARGDGLGLKHLARAEPARE